MVFYEISQKLKKPFQNSTKAIKDLSIYGFGQFFNLIAPFVAIPYIISVCGEENFGKIGVGLAVAFFVLVFIDYGTDVLGVKYISINRNDHQKVSDYYRKVFVSKFFLTIAVIIASSALYFFIPYFKENQMVLLLGFPILIGQFLNPIWVFQGLEKYNWISFINIFSRLLYLVFVFMYITTDADYIYVNFFFGIGMIIPNLIGSIKIIRDFNIKIFSVSFEEVRTYLKEDFSFCFSQFFLALKNYSPVVLLGFFGGFKMAGHYKIVEQIVMPIRTYLQVFFRFFYPKLSYKLTQDHKNGMSFWKKINVLNFIFIFILLILICFYAEEILKLFKVDPSVIGKLSDILKFFLIYPLVFSITFALEMLYFLLGKRSNYVRFVVATVILNIILMSLLIPELEIYGVIISLIASELILITLYLNSFNKKEANNENKKI